MIQFSITPTSKGYGRGDRWQRGSSFVKSFNTMAEAKKYLQDQYGKAKKQKMYIDVNGETIHCGYIFGFRDADYSHYPVQHWLQQDWVEFRNVDLMKL